MTCQRPRAPRASLALALVLTALCGLGAGPCFLLRKPSTWPDSALHTLMCLAGVAALALFMFTPRARNPNDGRGD